jgi:2-amino-4-hydroxy-6-hydroxymethyldihydropteridine diphosphokinase
MADIHRLILSLGSNIDAESNLPKAVRLLHEAGRVEVVSSVWESESVGFDGPNFLNACITILSPFRHAEFKEKVIRPIESVLGRIRSTEKNAPRPIDVDVVMDNDKPINTDFWGYAFVIVPLAELKPNFIHPVSGMKLSDFSNQLQGLVWMRKREDVLIS